MIRCKDDEERARQLWERRERHLVLDVGGDRRAGVEQLTGPRRPRT
jgi:hypothetical protein